MLNRRMSSPRAAVVIALAAVLAIAVSVTPSLAGSFLTKEKAARLFLSEKQASKIYLRHSTAAKLYLSHKKAAKKYLSQKSAKATYLSKKDGLPKKDAEETYLTQDDAANTYVPVTAQPYAALSTSNAVFGPVNSTTAVDIPTSQTPFTVPDTGLAVVTFTATALCTGATNGVACPVNILVDGGAIASKTPFLDTSSALPAPQATANTITASTVLTPGDHVASAQYAGSADASLNFKLTSWNLVVQGYPGQ